MEISYVTSVSTQLKKHEEIECSAGGRYKRRLVTYRVPRKGLSGKVLYHVSFSRGGYMYVRRLAIDYLNVNKINTVTANSVGGSRLRK